MKTGIYGGTFDPPHLGHMMAAQEVKERLGLDRLLLIPAKTPPHKSLSERSAAPEDRLAMTALVADGLDPLGGSVTASDLELTRPGKSYTVDTLRALREQYPDDELWLLMGSDMLLSFRAWREPETICALAGICAFTRSPEDDTAQLREAAAGLERDFGAHTMVLPLERVVDVSSTELRGLLSGGTGDELLWCQVYGYILRKGLYGVRADLTGLPDDDLRAVSYSMMRAKRIPHVRGTEEEAVRLAQRWDADVDQARRAAILHDCTKYWTLDEHLAACAHYNVALDDLERQAEKLLHSKTGAALARYVFHEPEPVWRAIWSHTTGKGDMTLLEKILYIADYMEPHRDFPGVEKLRALAYEDLDQAVILGCEMSVAEMAEKGRPVHPNTYAALRSLKGMEA